MRRGGVLHGGAARDLRQLDAEPQPHRPRPDHRREQLRHRPHRLGVSTAAASPASASSAATTRPRAAPASRQPVGDFYRGRLRGPRDGPRVRRQPHVQRHAAATARAATATPAPRSSRAAARRSWPTPASASRTTCSPTATRTSRSAATTRSTTYTSTPRPAINEVQTVSLTDFDGTDSLHAHLRQRRPPARSFDGANYTAAGIQAALQGPSEVQTVPLTGYDDQRRLLHARLQGRRLGADRPRAEQHRRRHRERDRAAATSSSR